MRELRYICNAATGYMPGLEIPDFKTRREEVRWRVRHLNLSALDRQTRQYAASDPGIEWDPVERQYRIRRRRKDGEACPRVEQRIPCAPDRDAPPARSPAAPGGDDDPQGKGAGS